MMNVAGAHVMKGPHVLRAAAPTAFRMGMHKWRRGRAPHYGGCRCFQAVDALHLSCPFVLIATPAVAAIDLAT